MCRLQVSTVRLVDVRGPGTRQITTNRIQNSVGCFCPSESELNIKLLVRRGRQSFNISDGNFNSGSMRLSVFSKLKLFIIFWIAELLVLLNSDDSSKPRLAPLPCAQATRI